AVASDMRRSSNEPILRKILRAARLRLGNLVMSRLRPDRRKSFDCEANRYSFTRHEARRARMECALKQGVDEYREYVTEGNNDVHDLFSDPYNADVSLTPTSESARYKIAMMEQIMRRMGETAAKNNAALVFLLIPSAIDAADEDEEAEVDPVRYPEYK